MDRVRTNNGLKSFFELSVKNALWIVLIYAELILIALRDSLLNYIEKYCNRLVLVPDAISNNLWFMIATIVIVAIPLLYLLWLEFDFKKPSLRRLIAFVVTSILFFVLVNEKIHISCGNVIALCFAIYSASLCVLESIKFIWIEEREDPQRPDYEIKELSGFSVISDTSRMKDVGWGRYADVLVGKLFHTDISKEAFAVGINGEWGSGKTTFLNEIRKRIMGHAYVIDFFPWLSNSPAQIVKDYFARIKEIFENKDRSSSIIDDYVDLIIDLDVDSSLTKMAKLLKHRKILSLESARKKVEDYIPQDKPVIVVIDDLDRLEKDEIYEVLRLIRNTAKFKNVIYIVAYDKEYICGTLGMKGITAPREYLMKIFQTEITLPVFENSKLVELLIEELALQLGDNDKGKREIERLLMVTSKDTLPLSAVLRNFRDIKRFANLIALDIIHIEQGKSVYDILVRDLFVLELLHYRYESIYKLLLDERGLLLNLNTDSDLYVLKAEDVLPQDVRDDEYLKSLLRLLFGSPDLSIKPDKRSIRYNYNFINYFSLRPMINQIGRTEFNMLLRTNDASRIKQEMKTWLSGNREIINSLFIRLKEVSPENMNEQEMDEYLTALFAWAELKEDINSQRLLPYVCMTIFKSRNYNKHKDRQNIMHDKLVERFEFLIEQGRLLNAAAMIRGMYGIVIGTDDDGMVFLDEYYILEPKEVIELMSKCFKKLVDLYHPTDDDIIDTNSMLSLFVRNATSKPIEEAAEGKSFLCHRAFIAYFKSRAADNDIEKFYQTFYYDIYAETHGAMPDEIKDNVRIKIGNSFGAEYTYREFMRECFNLTDEQKMIRNKYLEDYICPIKQIT